MEGHTLCTWTKGKMTWATISTSLPQRARIHRKAEFEACKRNASIWATTFWKNLDSIKYIINGPDVLDAFQGVSERKIRAKSDLHIIIFDELDSIAKKRGADMGLRHMDDRLAILESLHAFQIDGLKVLNNIFIIGTTNRKELIDKALLREGRIELHVKVEYPDEQGRLQILGIYTRNMRQNFVLDKDVNVHEIACRTDGCSGSTLPSLVTRAHSYVVVHTKENGLLQHVKNDFKVTMNYFLCAIEDIKSRLQESDLEPSRMGKEEMFSTKVLRIEQEIARLKENTAHFQATVEMKLETLRCELLK
ncbi:unnamed protein product [Camellia sinensis]